MAAEPELREGSSETSSFEDLPETSPPAAVLKQLSPRRDAQWKEVFYQNVQQRALKLEKHYRKKEEEQKVEQKKPSDGLCREWFSNETMTLETRAYLLDKLLPTLVPGVEKLLRVAERKKALNGEEGSRHKFDPINYLGEYLMRHNPSYETAEMPNPYTIGLKAITDKLKTQVPETTMNKLSRMKTVVEERRKQRETVDKIKSRVTEMRKVALAVQFAEWTLDTRGQLPLALVQSALKSFLEVVVKPAAADAGTGIYARPLEAVGTLEAKLNAEQFAEYVLSYITNFSSDMFQELLKHLLQCANDARHMIRHDFWRQMFFRLFLDCDHGKVGRLNRLRILSLLKDFYDNCSELAKKGLWNPRKWPIVELDDIDLAEFWGDMEDDGRVPSEHPSLQMESPLRGLSEEAFILDQKLRKILSDTGPGAPKTGSAPEEAADASVAPKTSLEGEGSKGVPELTSTVQVEDQEGPGTEVVVLFDNAGATGEAIPVEPPDPALEMEEVDEKTRPDRRPAAAAAASDGEPAATPGQEVLAEQDVDPDKDLGLGKKDVSGERDLAAKASETESISTQGEEVTVSDKEVRAEGPAAQEEAQPESQELGPIAKPTMGTSEPPAQTPVEDQDIDLLSWPPWKPHEPFEKAPQLLYKKPWSGDLRTAALTFKYTDYRKEVREDWNNENTRFPGLRMNMIEIQAQGPPSSTSTFDKDSLNLPQFVQLMETFVGEEISLPTLKRLVVFVKENYIETEKEKINQLELGHRRSLSVRQQLLLAALFEKWDNECSGYLDMEEVDAVLDTFKEGMEQEALNKAKMQLPIPLWHPSGVVKLSQEDFQTYMELVASELTGSEDEVLDNLVEFLMTSVERTHLDQLRGSARRKWLQRIQHTALTNGRCIEPVYQAVFKTLSWDADAHGGSKKISASIALLEYNVLVPERGDVLLRYVACTEDDAPYVLNQVLYMDMKGVSFASALDNKPIHVPRVQLHGNIHFWNDSRPRKERKGSFLVMPLEDIRRRVFGVLGMDTIRDQNKQSIFVPHEIRFYQGISNTFSIAYHHIRTQESIMQVILTAMKWVCARAPSLHGISAYFMEPGEDRMQDYTLRLAVTTNRKRKVEIPPPPAPVFSRKENLFRDYLFKCIDCSEVVTMCVYENHHIAVPLRDPKGQAVVVLDLNLGQQQTLPSCEHKDLQMMLRTAQAATCEILKEAAGDLDPCYVLEAEFVGDWRRGGVLFYRCILQDLQNCIWNLDPLLSFGEIKCYEEPPILVHQILKCVLLILCPQWAATQEVDNWRRCIEKIDAVLLENICYFDPTAAYVQTQSEVPRSCLRGIYRRDVWKLDSVPMEYLYNWALTCLALIDLAKELQHAPVQTVAVSPPWMSPSLAKTIKSSGILATSKQKVSFA